MLVLADFPSDLHNFPRNNYKCNKPMDARCATEVRLADGARRASRACGRALRKGRGVDARCLILAVLDKVVQLYQYALEHIKRPWLLRRVHLWRTMVDELIGIAYGLALESFPSSPPFELVRLPVRVSVRLAMEWFNEYGHSFEQYVTPRRAMDIEAFLGPFAIRRGPVRDAVRGLAGLSISTGDVRSSDTPTRGEQLAA